MHGSKYWDLLYFQLLCYSIKFIVNWRCDFFLYFYFMLGLSAFLMYSVHEGMRGISLDPTDHTETLMPITGTLFAVGVDFHAGKHPSFCLFLNCLCLSFYLYIRAVTSLWKFLPCPALWSVCSHQRDEPRPIHHTFHVVYRQTCDLVLAASICTWIKPIEFAGISSFVEIKGWDRLSKLMPEAPQINVPSYLLNPASQGTHCNILDNPSNRGCVW